MTRLLQIDSSIMGEKSLSRRLTAELVEKLRGDRPGLEVVYRDVAAAAPPMLSSALFFARGAGSEPEDAALRAELSTARTILEEFLAADIVVIGAPMYNFSIPTQLRGWIDHLVVPGKTFAYTADGLKGLVTGKRVIVVSTRGSLYAGNATLSAQDHQEAYLRTTFGNLGVTDFAFVRAEGVGLGPAQKEEALASARRDIAALAAA